MSEIERVGELQRAINEEWARMTPEERAADSIRALSRMEGQSYLFRDLDQGELEASIRRDIHDQ